MGSKIEWLARPGTKPESWNPWVGCWHVSPDCANCYAERMAGRLRAMGVSAYQHVVGADGWTGRVEWAEAAQPRLYKPRRWKEPRTIFLGSMSDPFHETVPPEWLRRVWQTIRDCPHHTFIAVTKRATRMHDYVVYFQREPPPPNLWLVVTAEDQQRAEERIPQLLATPAAVRGCSVEPMLGPVDITHGIAAIDHNGEPFGKLRDGLDWVICGGESGPGARPMDIDWARGLRDQCQAAGVPFFFKQDGPRRGHLLDGREWREWPNAGGDR